MAADSLSNLAGVPPKDVTWEDPKAVTTRLGELGRLKRPDLVQRLLVGMAAEGMEINIFHCSSAASAYEKSSHWHRALLLLSQMSRMQLEANEYTQSVLQTASAQASLWQLALESTNAVYNVGDSRPSVVAACCSGGSWEFVFLTLSGLSLFSVSTSVTSVPLLLCSAAISSLGTRPDTWNSSSNLGPLGTTPWAMWAASLLLLQHLQNLRSSPDIVVVGAASSVCEKGEQWRWAQELLGWTSWLKLRPNLITSNSFISACQKSSLWPVALHHLHEAAAASIAPDTLSFNAAISACRRTWRRALQHLKLMKIWGIQWSNISYNSVMSSELQWLRSLGMMESMRATQVQTARVTYNAILDAMERGSMWQSGAGMFAALRTVQPDVVTYASSISSYVQVDAWAAVLELLTSMRSSHCTANTVTMTSAICACTERWLLATRLFRQLRAGNLKPNELSSSGLLATMEVWWQSLGSLTWMHQLGINGLPFNAAAASCALQFQWPRCLHLASENLDVVSSNALAVVCYRIHHPHLAATLMGPLQMAALETLSRQKKKQSMNQDSDLADSRPHENSGAAFLSFLNQGWNANEDLQHKDLWMDSNLPNTGKTCMFASSASVGEPSRLDLPDPLSSLCSRPSTTSGPSRFLSPIEAVGDESSYEDATHPSVLAGREQNLRCGLVVADLNKRGVAECFEEYGLRDYFDQYGQRRFCNLSMSVAARRHPQVSRAFGSTSQHLNDRKTQNLFSAIAYRKASAMIEQDRQAHFWQQFIVHREQREVQFRGLTHAERYRTADVRRRQLQLILSGFPNLQDAQVPFLPAGMTEEVFQPVEATSRQQERDDRKRCERHNVYLAERNPQTVFLVKRQGWIFSYDDVLSIWEKLDDWMGAISLTPLWGLDRSTFSQFLVDLSLIDKDHLPHVWAHQVFDAYAKPTRLAAGDPDYDEPPDGRERAALCVSRWDFMHVLDRLLRTRFDLSPREEFLSRLRAAYNHLRRDWKAREEDSKIAAQASEHKWQAWKQLLGNVQVMQQTVAQRFGGSKSARGTTKFKSTVKPIKDDGRIKESLRWKFDRHVSCMLKEPEVMKMVEQFREVFSTIFDCYASQREKRHMAEVDLVSLCYDLCLVPDLAPRHEVHRVYMMAECLDKHPTPSLASSLTSDLSNVSTLSVPSRGSFKDAGVKKSSKPKLKTSMAEVVKSKRKLIHGMTKSEKSISSSLKFEGADFGVGALAECLCRIVFGHLLVYGNSLQQIMSSEARFVWLISYLVHVLRQDRAGESKGSMPDWPGWRGRAWTSLLERLRDEDFRNATPPMAQAAPVEMDGLRRATSHRPAAHHNSDTEDEGSPDKEQRAPQTFELPSFAKDAPDLSNWLFAKLLVCPIDIMAHKNRGSRTDKPRKTTSRPAH